MTQKWRRVAKEVHHKLVKRGLSKVASPEKLVTVLEKLQTLVCRDMRFRKSRECKRYLNQPNNKRR